MVLPVHVEASTRPNVCLSSSDTASTNTLIFTWGSSALLPMSCILYVCRSQWLARLWSSSGLPSAWFEGTLLRGHRARLEGENWKDASTRLPAYECESNCRYGVTTVVSSRGQKEQTEFKRMHARPCLSQPWQSRVGHPSPYRRHSCLKPPAA
jgi:hypothetical protein